jgi:DNA polymerase delta subunit 1
VDLILGNIISYKRVISIPTPKTMGIMKFAEKKKTCLNCKTEIKNNDAVCNNCQDKKGEIYEKLITKRNYYEDFYSKYFC